MPTTHLYPYRTVTAPIDLVISSVGDAVEIDTEQRRIVLGHSDEHGAVLKVRARIEPATFEAIGFEGEAERLALMLRLVSVSSRLREALHAPSESLDHEFEVALTLEDLRGDLVLDAVVVLNEAVEPVPDRATAAGSVVAQSVPWTIVIDAVEPPPGRSIRIEWTSFKASENGDLPDDHMFAMRLDSDPVLLLNRDIDNAYEVLESRGTHGAKARIRDAVFHQILLQGWTSLIAAAWSQFVAVCADADVDGLEILDEIGGWQRVVIVEWATFLVREANGDREQSIVKLVEMARDPASSAHVLISRVPSAIQDRFKTVRSFEGLVKDAHIFGGQDDGD